MSDQLARSEPTSRKAVKFLTAATIGTTLSLLSGLTLTGTVLGLILVTPLVVIFSPVLVPAVITVVLASAGLLFSGGCGAVAVASLIWMYRFISGIEPVGASQIEGAKDKLAVKAREMKEKVKEQGQQLQQKPQDTH